MKLRQHQRIMIAAGLCLLSALGISSKAFGQLTTEARDILDQDIQAFLEENYPDSAPTQGNQTFWGTWGEAESFISIYPTYPQRSRERVCIIASHRQNHRFIEHHGFIEGSLEDNTFLRTREEIFRNAFLEEERLSYSYLIGSTFLRVDNDLIWGLLEEDDTTVVNNLPFLGELHHPADYLLDREQGHLTLRQFYAAGCRLSPSEPMAIDLPEKESNLPIRAEETVSNVTVRLVGGNRINDLTFEVFWEIENMGDRPFTFFARDLTIENRTGPQFTYQHSSDIFSNTVQPGGILTGRIWLDRPWDTASQEDLILYIKSAPCLQAPNCPEFSLPIIQSTPLDE